jgi:hypothetical protein
MLVACQGLPLIDSLRCLGAWSPVGTLGLPAATRDLGLLPAPYPRRLLMDAELQGVAAQPLNRKHDAAHWPRDGVLSPATPGLRVANNGVTCDEA